MGHPGQINNKQEKILASADWTQLSRIAVPTVGGLSENWTNRRYKTENLWAFLPIAPVEVPLSFSAAENNNPIDAFINRKLNQAGIEPSFPADKRTLIRRATYDLIGLPPTEAEIQAFLNDSSPNAFEKVIDRLLESPHYGEQWGRHWLDVVRYADSGGFSNDYMRPNAWRYRDYVIRSFNEDKPYNQFVQEQIAGDELDPGNPEMLIAAGFLRMGPWEHTGMSVFAETRQVFLDDVTNIVGEAFLSLPLNCAKCHDHKFDPIAAKDYYQVQAVFATTQFADRPAPFMAKENAQLSKDEKQRILDWIALTKFEQDSLRAERRNAAAKAWFQERNRPYLTKRKRRKLPDNQQPPRYYGLTFADLGYRKMLDKRLQTLRKKENRFEPIAFSVYNGPNQLVHSARPNPMPDEIGDEPPPTYILNGGSVHATAEMVEPGILSAIDNLQTALDGNNKGQPSSTSIPKGMKGRRLAFAQWLTNSNHPITSRSMVNRIWSHHFGKGIAGNPNNFGATGKKPTHPELLDWLAIYFMENDWSMKTLHRLIMQSQAYQRSGEHPNWRKLQNIDPENQFLAIFKPRRLEAEEIRDAMLFNSGELNLEIGGTPVRPEINQEVALQPRQIMGSIAQAYQPSRTPTQRNRRSVYIERYRNLSDPFMDDFNQPGTNLPCEERTESTVATQAFTQLNGQQTRDRAIAMAHRLNRNYSNVKEQVNQAILQPGTAPQR